MRAEDLGVGWVERSETHRCGERWVSPRCAALPTLRLRAATLGGLLLLTACTTLPFLGGAGDGDLIAYAASLTRMEAEQRRQALTAAQRRWRRTATPRDRARLGLAYGQWGHDGYDPAAAARNLHGALAAAPADWREGERDFLEARAALLDRLAEREDELADARREIGRLENALDDAERKLRAIADIERNLDDRNGRGE